MIKRYEEKGTQEDNRKLEGAGEYLLDKWSRLFYYLLGGLMKQALLLGLN
jgi:hypothetical protein